jgi:hypothetical protein
MLELFRAGRHGQVLLTAPKDADVLIDSTDDAAFEEPLAKWRIAHAELFT